MKKYIWFGLAFLFITSLYLVLKPDIKNKVLGTSDKVETPTPTSSYKNQVTFEFGDRNITGAWYKVEDPFNIKLTANFEEKIDASDYFAKNECKFLSSAGFYTKDDKPTGLFVSEGQTIRKYAQNSLLNGIVSVNYIGTPRITSVVPDDPLRLALQSGPLLKENAEFKKLSLKSDEEARRVVAAVTGNNELYFIVFYDKSSAYIGPNLKDLPEVLAAFERESRIEFADAINLDGGSATAFYVKGQNQNGTDTFSLSEVSSVGSFFCEK